MTRRLANFLPAVISAALVTLAFPPFNLLFLVFVALAPWVGYLRVCTAKEARSSGLVFGVLFFGAQLFWIYSFVNQWVGNPVIAVIPWLVATALGAPFYALAGGLIHRCWIKGWPWAIPLVWAGAEAFRIFIPGLSFPWAQLGLPLARIPALVQAASLGTLFLVSAWVMLFNVLVAFFIFPPKGEKFNDFQHGRLVVRMGLAFVGIMLVPGVRMLQIPEGTRKVFTLAQPGLDMAFSARETRPMLMASAGQRLMSAALHQASDLVIFPEGFGETSEGIPPLSGLGSRPPMSTIFGAIRKDGDQDHQSAFAYDGSWQFADKTRLVIFGEYVPFRDNLPFLKSFNLPSGDLTPGLILNTPVVNKMKLGPLICFEGVFTELAEAQQRQGAQVLVQMSIDDWYETTPAHEQLWLASIWRSIESGLPLVRVGSRGKTLATDSRGRILAMAPIGQEIPLRVEVNVPKSGDGFLYRTWFIWLCVCLVWFLLAENLAEKLRSGLKATSQILPSGSLPGNSSP